MKDDAIGDDGERRAAECDDCGRLFFPRPAFCPACQSENLSARPLGRSGRLYAYSTIHVGDGRFALPYTIAFADLPDGLRIFGRLDAPAPLDSAVEIYQGAIGAARDGAPIHGVRFRAAP